MLNLFDLVNEKTQRIPHHDDVFIKKKVKIFRFFSFLTKELII